MNIIEIAYSAPPSLHDLSEGIPAAAVLYTVIVVLGAAVIWFIVRDRNSISEGLHDLTEEFKEFRKDLAMKYATKHEVEKLEEKFDEHIAHHTQRGSGKSWVSDAEEK